MKVNIFGTGGDFALMMAARHGPYTFVKGKESGTSGLHYRARKIVMCVFLTLLLA